MPWSPAFCRQKLNLTSLVNNMKIATFNANSVRTRLEIISDWLKAEQPDILCLQETKVQDKDFPEDRFRELGYQVAFRGQKAYNGVAIVSRHPVNDVQLNLPGKDDDQARFISATIMGICIINAYVPQGVQPGTDKFLYKLQWLSDLLSYLEASWRPDIPILLAGDFNVALEDIDVHDPDGLRGNVGFHPDEQAMLKSSSVGVFQTSSACIIKKAENTPSGITGFPTVSSGTWVGGSIIFLPALPLQKNPLIAA